AYAMLAGAEEICGRGASFPVASNRYGGEKISAVSCAVAFDPSPLPAVSTRASGSSTAVEWYTRMTDALASVDHNPVAGFQRSAANTAPDSSVNPVTLVPPLASTVPSASSVALNCRRGYTIDPT